MKEPIVRSISGILYISIVIFSMFAPREWFIALFLGLGWITIYEFLKLVGLKSFLAYLLLPIALYFFSYNVVDINALYLLLIISVLINLLLLKDLLTVRKVQTPLFKKKEYIPLFFYIIGGFVFITRIPFKDGVFVSELIIAVFIMIWANDTFAYIIGKNFGKKKLLARISPKKTVEGFLGGLLGTATMSFLIFEYTEMYSIWIWIVLACIVTCTGTIGDLVQSKCKRQAGVKDSGTLMPGHGGIYDRLDSIVYASPFIYGFLQWIDYVS